MRTFSLKNCNLTIPVLQLGSAEYGASIHEQDAFSLLDRYVAAGGTLVDTALVYGRWMPEGKSLSEQVIGSWLASRGKEKIMVATKGAHPLLDDGHGHAGPPRLAPEEIKNDIEESLKNLGLERIDLYYLHRDDPSRPVSEIIDTLHWLQQQGKIRCFGASNWSQSRLIAANQYAASKGGDGFAVCQNQYSAAVLNPEGRLDKTLIVNEDEDLPFFQERNILLTAFSSQARGYYSKLHEGSTMPNLTRISYDNPVNRARLAAMKKIFAETGWSIAQIALAYLTSQGVAAVIGPRTLQQLEDGLPAGDILLTEDMILTIRQAQ